MSVSSIMRRTSLLATLLVLLSTASLRAQTPIVEEPGYTPTLTFDVVSIRQSPTPSATVHVSVTSLPHSSRFETTALPLKALLQIAYGYDAPIVNGPEWLSNTFWNISARSDEAADARLAKLTDNEVRLEKRNAIRMMLAERLGLKTHTETRNTAVFHLVVNKGGVKMTASPAPPPPAEGEKPAPAPLLNIQTHPSQHGLEFVCSNSNMLSITGLLSSMVEAPVLNKTGLTGLYNYTLQMGREWSANDPESWPPIAIAVQDQMGLKLEPVRESVPNIVIDHIDKPTDN